MFLWIFQGCVTHQVICPASENPCLTHQTLVIHSTDRLREAGPIADETLSQLLSPLMEQHGYQSVETTRWRKEVSALQNGPSPTLLVGVPGPNTPCFRQALPHWLSWVKELSTIIDGPVEFTTKRGSDSTASPQLAVLCNETQGKATLVARYTPDALPLSTWLKETLEDHSDWLTLQLPEKVTTDE